MPYPTTAELIDASTNEALVNLTPEQQDSLRDSSIVAVEEFCQQSFEPFDGEVEVEARTRGQVYLPRRLRVLRSVTPYQGDPLELGAVAVVDNGARLLWRENVVGIGYYSQALYEVSGGDYPKHFPTGVLVIDGEWGWENVPPAVVVAIMSDMEDTAEADANAITPTVTYARKMGLTGISQGNLRIELGAVASLSPRVARLLEPYQWMAGVGHLI